MTIKKLTKAAREAIRAVLLKYYVSTHKRPERVEYYIDYEAEFHTQVMSVLPQGWREPTLIHKSTRREWGRAIFDLLCEEPELKIVKPIVHVFTRIGKELVAIPFVPGHCCGIPLNSFTFSDGQRIEKCDVCSVAFTSITETLTSRDRHRRNVLAGGAL